MTNNEIIINQAIAHGIYTKAEAQAIVAAKGCLPIHTFAEWKKAGFSVKRGEHAAIKLIPPPPEVTLIDLTEYTGPLDENGLPPSLTGNPPANHENDPDDHK